MPSQERKSRITRSACFLLPTCGKPHLALVFSVATYTSTVCRVELLFGLLLIKQPLPPESDPCYAGLLGHCKHCAFPSRQTGSGLYTEYWNFLTYCEAQKAKIWDHFPEREREGYFSFYIFFSFLSDPSFPSFLPSFDNFSKWLWLAQHATCSHG